MTAPRPFWSVPAGAAAPSPSSNDGLSPLRVLDEAQAGRLVLRTRPADHVLDG